MNTDLRNLSDDELLESAKHTAREERRWTERVLDHLFEVERRKLFAQRGFSSLWEYVVNELGYDGGAAQRRIQAMRLSRDLPEIKESLREEKVSLTSAAMLQSFFENERRSERKVRSPEEKREVLHRIEGLSTREAERVLREISPHALPRERERILTPTETEIRFVADAEMMQMIGRMKELLSGKHPNPKLEEVFRRSLAIAVEKLDRKSNREEEKVTSVENAATSARRCGRGRRFVPIKTRRALLNKAEDHCTFIDPKTGRRCSSRRDPQVEHVIPVARGGTNDPPNLTILCGTHNRLAAERALGPWVRKYAKSTTTARR